MKQFPQTGKDQSLREVEEKYKILVESSQTGIYIHQNDIIVYANERFAEIHGYTVNEMLGIVYNDLIHSDENERRKKIYANRLKGGDVPKRYEMKRVKKDGSSIW